MKTLFLFALLFTSSCCFGYNEAKYRSLPQYQITSDSIDDRIKPGLTKVKFVVREVLGAKNANLLYSIDGANLRTKLNDDMEFEHVLSSGKHIFQFYLSDDYFEIYTDSIHMGSQHSFTIRLNFQSSEQRIEAKKPVIYLYSKENIEAQVVVRPKGEFTFLYPDYNNGWDVSIDSSGLTVQGVQQPYLFWEAEQILSSSSLNLNQGEVVKSANVVNFLESKLTSLGLTSTEQADFITFWGPQLIKTESCYVQFLVNDECALFADLVINPTPNNLNRIYIIWSSDIPSKDGLVPQEFEKLDRSGFTVLEWGGAEIQLENL
jgi:hypothetical protein